MVFHSPSIEDGEIEVRLSVGDQTGNLLTRTSRDLVTVNSWVQRHYAHRKRRDENKVYRINRERAPGKDSNPDLFITSKPDFLLLEFAEQWQPCYSSIFSFGLVKTVHARLATQAGGKVVICLIVGDLSRLHLTEDITKYVSSHPKTLCRQTPMKTSFDMLRHS
uniref:Uncharacterized protein n=1 Tax=Timema cristinae TaxID=61476 RepID=A0A7R9CAZ2_TIMCR|nr:unnamed protein product [Timema cristinae]